MTEGTHLSPAELLLLRKLTTPTVFNGWEQITRRDTAADGFNLEEVRDFMPEMGPMVGRAVTAVIGFASGAQQVFATSASAINAWGEFRQYVTSVEGPKVIVVQDLSKPRVLGSMWGEIGATMYRALGCVGTITDGGVRDLNEMAAAGFKVMARRPCVGHGYGSLLRSNCEVEVFGRKVSPGQLIHADQHGFLALPSEDEGRLLEAAVFMDRGEAAVLTAAQNLGSRPIEEPLKRMTAAIDALYRAARDRFGRDEEKQ